MIARSRTAAALAAAAFVLVLSLAAGQVTTARAGSAAPSTSAKAQAFSASMAKLWEDHIMWTRMVIVDFAAGLPDLKTAEARLLRNQVDIGNAIKPFYGAAAGTKLTALLKTHILQAVTVLKAAKAGDKPQLNAALKAWYANADQIAAFLSHANAQHWPLAATKMMMKNHLDLTTKEAVDELGGHWAASVADYDKVENEILMMSHTLAQGIIDQFPTRFAV